jgi:Ca2+-binding RTX toxin-like protein
MPRGALTVAGLTPLIALVVPFSLPLSAAAVTPSCNGLPATILVPTAETRVDGTDGDDVIVATAGSHVVIASATWSWCTTSKAPRTWSTTPTGITVTGGTGVEDVQVSTRPGATGPVRIDLGGGNDVVDARANDLQIQTGPGSDTVAAGHLRFTTNTGWVRLGGGDDFFLLDGVPMGSMAQPVSGQSGRDTVIGTPYHDEIDLARIASWESGSSEGRVLIDGFEVANGQGELDKLWGTGSADLLRGGAGDDVLTGRGGDDVLLGGPGHDHGDGGPGTDQCSTEVRRNCER